MSAINGNTLSAIVPFVFLLTGVVAAACQFFVDRDENSGDTVEVDPDIRVRVTGKIS